MKTLILALLAVSGLVLFLFTAFTLAFRKGRKAERRNAREYPFVSLLKPIKNIDDGMAANLESFYRLDYPAYEVLFAVDDFKDPPDELPTLRRLLPQEVKNVLKVPIGQVQCGEQGVAQQIL